VLQTSSCLYRITNGSAMNDDKRLLRKLKREIKRAGNRQRRRYLKDVDAESSDFRFGRNCSDVMNEPRPQPNRDQGEKAADDR